MICVLGSVAGKNAMHDHAKELTPAIIERIGLMER